MITWNTVLVSIIKSESVYTQLCVHVAPLSVPVIYFLPGVSLKVGVLSNLLPITLNTGYVHGL